MFSLNREKRKQELLRVSQENFAILERITKCKPQYNVQMWNEDWQKTEKYMNSIARYPREMGKPQVILVFKCIQVSIAKWSRISCSSISKLYS